MKALYRPNRAATRMKISAARLRKFEPVVVADFMRTFPGQNWAESGMQNGIAQKIFDWLRPALGQVFAKPPTFKIWDDNDPESLPTSAIYKHHNIDPSTIGWIKTYRAQPKPEDIALLKPFFEGKFVVGFELSPFQCAVFDKLKVPYVSLAIHPLRFMKDYKFMLFSNFVDPSALSPLAIPTEDIAFSAQLKRAKMLAEPPLDLENDSAVLFGQVDIDAALIGPKGIMSLQNHAVAVRELCEKFDKVYFKPHPYGPNAKDQIRFLRQFENIELTAANPYALLSSDNVHTVAALTSSILTEARYFGKDPHALSSGWVDRSEEPCFGIEVLSPHFWNVLLEGNDSKGSIRPEQLNALSDISVQSLLNVSWETHGSAEAPISGVPVRLGKKMCFGRGQIADRFCTGSGWQPVSADHRWAGTNDTYLSFQLPPTGDQAFDVKLIVNAMASGSSPTLLQLYCQNLILAEVTLDSLSQETIDFTIPKGMASPLGNVEIELRSSHAHSPKSIVEASDMRALAVAVRSIEVKAPKNALPVLVGETYYARDFQAEMPFMPHGWQNPEDLGIWTNERHARLQITTPSVPDGDLVLTLGNTRAFLSEMLPQNTLFVRVNGEMQATQQFVQGEPGDLPHGGIDIKVPVPRAALCGDSGVATIDLEMLASHSPALAGYSADPRSLAINIESFRFESATNIAAEQPSDRIANIFGPFNIHTGLAVMARNSVTALEAAMDEAAGGPHASKLLGPRAINFNNSFHQDQDTGFVHNVASGSNVNIFSGDVTRVSRIVNGVGNTILNGRHNICYGAWELETMPTYLADTQYIDEYWGLSNFIADAARTRMDVPVYAFPIPVTLHFPEVLSPRARFGIPEEQFTFLFTFSVDSTMSRKNPQAVLKAFQTAFPDPKEPVCLVIKSMIRQASQQNRKEFEAFKKQASNDPRVVMVEDTLSIDENASLYMCSDAYISLHRAEGFGLTMAEAMGYGKPTIGTGYSGNLDFMNEDNSCLVKYSKVEMDPTAYHNQRSEWAEPDAYDAAQHMRRVYSDILFREKIARAGKQTIYEEFSALAVGRKIFKRLKEIHEAKR